MIRAAIIGIGIAATVTVVCALVGLYRDKHAT